MKRARGPRDALVHQRAAEIVGARLQARCDAVAAHLYPRGLNVLHDRMQRQAGDRMHQHGLPIGRPQPAEALKMQGRFGRNERQRHEFSEASGAALKIADVQQMPRPVPLVIDMAEHDSGGGLDAKGVGRFDDFKPLGGRDLVWTDDGADFIVEDFRRGAGQRAKAGFFQL